MPRIAPTVNDLKYFRVNRGPQRRVSALGGFGSIATPMPSVSNAAAGSTISLTPTQLSAAIAAAAAPSVILPDDMTMPSAGVLANALTTIVSTIPMVAVPGNLPVPSVSGTTHTGLSGFYVPQRRGMGRIQLGSFGAGTPDLTPQETSAVSTVLATTASIIAADAAIGAAAGPIGAAVGVVVGIICSLFRHKVVSPPTTQAQITAAKAFIASYKQIAGSVIGRSYPESTVQDISMAFCINADAMYNNAGGCGDQEGIAASWTDQLWYLGNFFKTVAATGIGDTVVLRDNPGLLGHGDTNTNVTFEFPNPGVQSPNYILGPLYAQYVYVMCNIFQDSANCAGFQLTAPVPQFYCDLVDWFRAQTPAWDIPPGTIDAPVQYSSVTLAPGQVTTAQSTATTPVLSLPALTLTATPPASNEEGESLTINPDDTATVTGGTLVNPAETDNDSAAQTAVANGSASVTSGGNVIDNATGAVVGTVNPDGSISAVFGMSSTEILLLLGAGALLLYLGSRKGEL